MLMAETNTSTPDLHPITHLPFVRDADVGRTFWHVASTGDYSLDCVLGGKLAEEAIAYMRRHNDPLLLGRIVRHMIERSDFTGLEVGFMHTIAAAVIGGYRQ